MKVQTRRLDRTGVGLEIGLTLLLALVALGWFVRTHPFQLSPVAEDLGVAQAATSATAADILVVLPTVSEALAFESLSFDQVWLNVVEREVGPVRVADATQLTRSVLDPCAWVIVPKRAASQLDPTQTQFIRTWVEDGGTVILEQPEGPWRSLIGQPIGMARARETRRITSFDGALSRGEMRADILEMPLRTTVAPYNPTGLARGRDYQVLLEVDGQPGVVSLHIGRGRVILLLFDFGQAAVSLVQGSPNPDFSIRARDNTSIPPGLSLTADLVADDTLRTAHIPFVDLLERNLLYLADVHRPIGRLWAYPGTSRGALLVAHSEAWYGPGAAYMPEWEHAHQHTSTLFAVSRSLSPEALARLGRIGTDVQLQWIPPEHPAAPNRFWGLGRFKPVRRPMGILEQVDTLNDDLIPYGPITASRSMHGLWPTDYFEGFRMLDAAGVFLDSSYGAGPARLDPTPGQAGYLFGTGRPFRPIDRNGNRFAVRELPITIDANTPGYSLQKVRSLIVDSSEGYHVTLAADWRPDVMAVRPSFDAIEAWQASFGLAESQELWVTSYAEYADFLSRREASHVESSFSREERRLTITAQLVGAQYDGDGEGETLTPSIAFPTRFEGRPVDRLIVDNQIVSPSTLALTGDRVLHLLALEPGEHRVQVFYATPVESLPAPPP